uniref:PCNA-associated factor n=1 Tax=Panthera leo TaxID=9689 RepID=A0A8C8XBM2_PANLE
MVRTKADSVPGTYRKVVASRAPRKVLGSSTSASNSASLSSRKVENKYAGGNPVCVRPTPKWQKGIGEFFGLSPKDSDKENRIPEEAGSSGLGKAKRKKCESPIGLIYRESEGFHQITNANIKSAGSFTYKTEERQTLKINDVTRGTWLAPTSTQVMISRFVSLSPMSGSVLTAQRL